jgi:hypothetical protein
MITFIFLFKYSPTIQSLFSSYIEQYLEGCVTAFYNTPEEFEREHYTQLSKNTIQTVNKRQQQFK